MRIGQMTATFGKLEQSTLRPAPGLNIIYAPNESGKSTWCQFIIAMLYGLPTRERGLLAGKNRVAPWNGVAMQGSMDIHAEGEDYTIVRTTQRAGAPMGACVCTYTGTADSVPHIDPHSPGETLLGIGREVFSRSAFIAQGALPLDKDVELERRISALVSSGEEEVSFSESYELLKRQLNRRRHNKTGLIPELEREIAQLTDTLSQLYDLHAQEDAARQQLQQFERQAEELRERLTQWEALEKQDSLRACLSAQRKAQAADEHAQSLRLRYPDLPSAQELSRLQGMADALDRTLAQTEEAGELAVKLQGKFDEAQRLWQQDPLYPDDDGQLAARLSATDPKPRRFSPLAIALSLFVGCATAFGAGYTLHQLPIAAGCGILAGSLLLLLYNSIRLRRNKADLSDSAARRAQLEQEIAGYLQLRQQYESARDEAQRAASAAHSLHRSCREGLLDLLRLVQPFSPDSTNLTNVRAALERAASHRRKVDQAQQEAHDARLHWQLLHQHLPQGPFPDPGEQLPRPTTTYAQIKEALPRAQENIQTARARLSELSGQLSALGSRDALESRLQQKKAELDSLQEDYDAIALAMDTLVYADQTMQNRFSPALGRRAAEIFSELTDGRYQQVLLDRSFALSTSTRSDPLHRDIRLLSHGTADQLYLATRLAICEMVLPEGKSSPLILDDALANFDHQRMAAALEWLAEAAKTRQILLFTCHRREAEYLVDRNDVTILSL